MTQILRQSTAVDVLIGPFLDLTDGATSETGESPSVKLSKNGQALAAKSDVTTPVHDADGYYNCELDATDTNTVGTMILTVAKSATALPVRHEFMVIEEALYDAIYASGAAVIPANVTQYGGVAGTFSGGRPEVNTSHIAGSAVSTSAAQIGVNVVNAGGMAWASGSLTSGVFATGAITAAAIAADAIGASELAADAIAEIADAVWDEDATGHQTQGTFGQAIGDPGADSDSIWALANTNLDATVSSRLASASYTAPPSAASIADAVWDEAQADHVGVGTFGITASEIADILVDTAEIGAAGAGLSAIPWNASWDAEVQSEVDDALVAQNLDHLVKIAVDTNFATTVHADSVIGQIADNGAGFDRTTDSLEAIRDRGDAAWITATGFSTHSAADVWSVATRSLTVLDEDSTTLDLDATLRAAMGLAAANLDTQLAAIVEDTGTTLPAQITALNNLSAAQVNAEVVDALATDTYAEPGQGTPAATLSLSGKIGYLYKAWRNRSTMTSSEYALYADDAVTKDQEAAVSDNGTTFERGEVATGA